MKDLNTDDRFDDLVRNSLEGMEMPFDQAAWGRLEARLPKTPPKDDLGASWLKGLGIAAAVIGAVAVAIVMWPSTEHNEPVAVETGGIENAALENDTDAPHPMPLTEHTEPENTGHAVEEPTKKLRTPSIQTGDGYVQPHVSSDIDRSINGAQSVQTSAQQSESNSASKEPDKPTPMVNLSLKLSRNSVCVGEEVSMMAFTNTGGLKFEWLFSDGERKMTAETSRKFNTPGTYDVTLTASRDGNTWERTASIDVKQAPEASFEMQRPVVGIPLYELKASVREDEICRWEFSDGRKADGSEVRQLFRSRGLAQVSLHVSNSDGCAATAKQSVRIGEDFRLFAETGFTPNGDGLNDSFLPKALEVIDCDFEMTIRDLSGKEIFRTSNINNPWNGRENNSGTMMPGGTYIWTVVLTDEILRNPVFAGDITLQQ